MAAPEPDAGGGAPGAPRGTGLGAVLGRPNFSLLVVGQTGSQLGDRLHHMALIALIGTAAEASTSGIELAKLVSAITLPVVLFGPIVGALVDRWNKRTTMIVTDLLRAILVAFIPLLYREIGFIWPVYVIAFLVALLGLFFNSAKMALIPDLVSHGQLLSANAALTSIGRFATIAGVVGGGVIISWTIWERLGWQGYEAGFYIDALSYGLSVATLLLIGRGYRPRAGRSDDLHFDSAEAAAVVKGEMKHLASDIRATLGLIRRNHDLRFVFFTVVLLGVLAASIFVILTASVQTVMGLGTRSVGYLGGLLAAGMIVGSLGVGTIGKAWNKRHIVLFGCFLMGAFMIVGAFYFSYQMFAPIAFLGGMVLGPVMISQDTLVHEVAPPDARALIFSTRDLVLGAAFMGAALAVGAGVPLLEALGAEESYRLALFVFGVLITAAAVGGELAVLRDERAATRNSATRAP
ncbi:MAG TPA: MFS transporter [Gemmatimonadaceae bacterium]|nr:MFS transporter [Gemmatimonadaceae bacterium]